MVALPRLQQPLRNISQHKLFDLPAPRQRHLIWTVFAQPKHVHRRFVSTEHFPHPCLDFFEIGFLGPGFELQECGGHFDVAGVRDADDDGAGDGGVLH
jgi:hypothetical protein